MGAQSIYIFCKYFSCKEIVIYVRPSYYIYYFVKIQVGVKYKTFQESTNNED